MKKVLDKYLIRKYVRKLEDMSEEPALPDGMNREETDLMVKILSAKHMQEIEDVSLDEIVSLFDFVDVFAEFITIQDCFSGKYGDFESNLLSMDSANRRRLL